MGRRRWGASVATVVATIGLSAVSGLAAPAALEGIPQYDHVVILVLENESYAATFTNMPAPDPYIRSLVGQGVLDDQYFATGHVSLDNYIAMVSGQPNSPATGSDCLALSLYDCVQNQTAVGGTTGDRNLGDQLDGAGVTWKGYLDGTTAPCVHDVYSPTHPQADTYQGNGGTVGAGAGSNYADRHNPFLYFADIVGNDATRCQPHLRPYSELAGDIGANTVPGYAFITPDTCHDGHDNPCSGSTTGGLAAADQWSQAEVPALLTYLNAHNGLLILTFDEGAVSDTSGCCHGGPGGQIGAGGRVGLIALGPGVRTGAVIHTPYDHASMLRTVEDTFGVSEYLNNAASSVAMADLFESAVLPEHVGGYQALAVGLAIILVAAALRRRRWRAQP